MDIDVYIPLITFAENNITQGILLGSICDDLFKNYDISDKISELDDQTEIFFDKSRKEFKRSIDAEFFYSIHILAQAVSKPRFNLFDFIIKSNFSELQRKNQISYHFDTLLLVNACRVFNIDTAEMIVKQESIPDRVNQLFFENTSHQNVGSPYFLDALERSTKGITPDQNYITLNADLRRIGKEYPSLAEEAINMFKDNPEKNTLFLPHLFLGLIERDGLAPSITKLENILHSSTESAKIAAIRAISRLHGNINYLKGHETRIEKAYFEIIEEGNIVLIAEILNSFGLLINYLPSAVRMIVEIPNKFKESQILYTLAYLLWIHSDTKLNEPWFNQSLKRLTSFDNSLRGIFQNLYMTFIGLQKNNPEKIFEYFEAYIENEANDPTAIEGFKNIIISLAQKDQIRVELAITDWFNHENSRFHAAAVTTCSILWVNGVKELSLNKERLDSFTLYDIEFTLLKIVGYVASKEHLQSLLFSSLKRSSISKQHFQMLVELFVSYVALNYPGTLDYLEEKRASASPIEINLIDTVKSTMNSYHANRLEKPSELNPSLERLRIFHQERNLKFQKQDMRGHYPDASITDFVSKVTIKNGQYYFSRVEKSFGKYTPKSSLQKFAMNMEMPGGEFIDPTGQAYNRALWRMFKRRSQ